MGRRSIRLAAPLCLAVLASSCFLLNPVIPPPEPWFTDSGLVIYDLLDLDGEPGDEVVVGSEVTLHYTASLHNGEVFDSSRDRGQPITFVAGQGQVPAGFDEGSLGMLVGEVRRVVVPPHLAYGDAGVEGVIPPAATIVFDIELLEASPPAVPEPAQDA